MNFHQCNYGATYSLTENPYHKTQLARMVTSSNACAHTNRLHACVDGWRDLMCLPQGLRPDTIFGCLYEYLFEPLPEIKEMFRTQLDVMQDSTLKIAIQVWELIESLLAWLLSEPVGCDGPDSDRR